MYFGARWYDPELGRFISQDPAKDGLNWYAYCNNNPLKYIDPDGFAPRRNQACNINQLIGFVRNFESTHSDLTRTQLLSALSSQFKDAVGIDKQRRTRYLYTKDRGWLDMQHFFESATKSTQLGADMTLIGGYVVEIQQKGKPSSFSYEDIPFEFCRNRIYNIIRINTCH